MATSCAVSSVPNLTAMSLEPHFNEELATLYECTANALQGIARLHSCIKVPLAIFVFDKRRTR